MTKEEFEVFCSWAGTLQAHHGGYEAMDGDRGRERDNMMRYLEDGRLLLDNKMPYHTKASYEELLQLLPHKWKLTHPESVMTKTT